MTTLERQIRKAQHRLWINRWISNWGWTLAGATIVFIATVIAGRVFQTGLEAQLGWLTLGLLGASVLVAGIWTLIRRESQTAAAIELDSAAGLKERLSTGLYCATSKDPFAKAALEDAQRIGGRITVRQHIRFAYPRSINFAGGTLILSALTFLFFPQLDVMGRNRVAQEEKDRQERIERATAMIKRNLDENIEKIVKQNPDVKAMEEFSALGDLKADNIQVPEDIIRQEMKKIDNLSGAVQGKREEQRFEGMPEFKKMMRQLDPGENPETAVNKLAKSLASGDFKAAQDALKQMQDKLATAGDQNSADTEEMKKQLAELAKKLNQLADSEKRITKKLEEAGLDEEQVKRMLENLAKKDLDQLKDELKKAGMDEEKAEQLAQQMQQQENASKMASKLGSAMKMAAAGGMNGQGGNMDKLGEAIGQLSEMEMLQEEMKQLDATLAELDQMKQNLGGCKMDGKCSACAGGNGGMGENMVSGQGGIAPEKEGDVKFKRERAKVNTERGKIIGQYLVDGSQIAGESKAKFVEAATADQRDAADAVDQDRIPRKHQDAVKKYHSLLIDGAESAAGDTP
jgi:hypothetical protein